MDWPICPAYRTFLAGAAVVTLALGASAAQADTLSNTPSGGSIGAFGSPDTLTYGQTFTAPLSGTLGSFTLYLNGAIGGTLYGGVGVWNCGPVYLEGCGVSATLFESAEVAAITPAATRSHRASPCPRATSMSPT